MRLPLKGSLNPLRINHDVLRKMVDSFIADGFTYFDTAYMYHGGLSEVAARKDIVARYPRERFTLTDKLPIAFMKSEKDNERIFKKQLNRCGVDYFDYYLLHNLGEENYAKAIKFRSFEFLKKIKDEGRVRKIGFSYHDSAELLDKILTEHPEIEIVQLQINYLDWENESIQSRKCYEVAVKHNKPVIVMEPVKGGSLAKVPEQAEKIFTDYNKDASVASWAIRFAASLPAVEVVLSGMSDFAQLKDNTGYMNNFTPLNDTEKAIINEARNIITASIAVPCTACRYCSDGCPVHIAIPEYFSLYNAEKLIEKKNMFSVQQTYYDNLIKKFGKASACINCGKCEKSCPQHIQIRSYLKEVAKTFGK